jgi:hypothetical protein
VPCQFCSTVGPCTCEARARLTPVPGHEGDADLALNADHWPFQQMPGEAGLKPGWLYSPPGGRPHPILPWDPPCADPGFLDDKKPRWRLATAEQVQVAKEHFAKPENRSRYTTAQLSTILDSIRGAARMHQMGIPGLAPQARSRPARMSGADAKAVIEAKRPVRTPAEARRSLEKRNLTPLLAKQILRQKYDGP